MELKNEDIQKLCYQYFKNQWYVWNDPDGQAFFASQSPYDITARLLGYKNKPVPINAENRKQALEKAMTAFDKERGERLTKG